MFTCREECFSQNICVVGFFCQRKRTSVRLFVLGQEAGHIHSDQLVFTQARPGSCLSLSCLLNAHYSKLIALNVTNETFQCIYRPHLQHPL